MSIQLIQQYYAKVEQIIRYTGARNESTLRQPFHELLMRICTVSVETMKIIQAMPEEAN
jgi:hypothetical protein